MGFFMFIINRLPAVTY